MWRKWLMQNEWILSIQTLVQTEWSWKNGSLCKPARFHGGSQGNGTVKGCLACLLIPMYHIQSTQNNRGKGGDFIDYKPIQERKGNQIISALEGALPSTKSQKLLCYEWHFCSCRNASLIKAAARDWGCLYSVINTLKSDVSGSITFVLADSPTKPKSVRANCSHWMRKGKCSVHGQRLMLSHEPRLACTIKSKFDCEI